MPDFNLGGVGVSVEPDFTGFAPETNRKLDVIERELKPVEVKIVADLIAGFKTEAEKKAKAALAAVRVSIDLEPNTRGFKTETERLVKQVAASVNAEIRVSPKLAKDFRKVLRAEVETATKGAAGEVNLRPSLSKDFKKELRAEITKATAGVTGKVQLDPSLSSDFRSKMKALLKTATANAVTVDVTVNPENVADIRRKLKAAVLEASAGLVVRVSVIPEVGTFRERLRAETGKLSVSSRPKVSVGADTSPFARELKTALATAKSYAVLPVRVAMSGGTSALGGLKTLLDGTLKTVKNLTLGLGILGIAIGAVGASGVKSAAEFEYAQDAFKLLLEDAKLGQQIFDGLLKASKETIFEVPDLSPVARQLIVIRNTLGEDKFGIDRILPSLTTITDMGAALDLTGPQIQRIGLALGKIAGRGKLTSEELRSIAKNAPGFSAIGAIADKLGVSIPEAFDAVREGAVESSFAIDAILEGMKKFPGALGAGAREAQETFKGALSNLPDIARIAFFESFESQLPRLTKLIGPDGPLVGAMEATLPAIAQGFTPLAEQFLMMVMRMTEPIEAVVLGMVPVISAVLGALGDMAPAFTAVANVAGDTLLPVAEAFRRLAQVVTVFIVQGLDRAAPAFERLGDSAAGFLGAVGEIAGHLAPLIPLFVDLAAVIVTALGGSYLALAEGFAEGFKTAAPVLEDVVRTVALLVREAAPLLAVLGEIVAIIGTALVKAVRSADLEALSESIGELAVAGAEIVVALTPLIPVAAEIVTILARELVPVLTVMAPVISAVVIAISPLLIVLARMAPLLLVVFAVAKVAAWGKAMTDTFLMVTASSGKLGERIFDVMTNMNWNAVRGKMIAGAGIATAAVSGMFLGMATDATSQITSIISAAAGIGIAFAMGGPIMGAVAIATTAIGFFFGQAKKRSDEAKKAMSEYQTQVKGLREAFDAAGVDRFSSSQAKGLVVAQDMLDLMKKGGKEAGYLNAAFDSLGIQFDVVAGAVGRGKDGMRDLNIEIERATYAKAAIISKDSVAGVQDFGRFTDEAQSSLTELIGTIGTAAGKTPFEIDAIFRQETIDGHVNSLKDVIRIYEDAGVSIGSTAEVQRQFTKLLQERLGDTPAAQFIAGLGPKTLEALHQQEELGRVQKFITDEQERNKGSAMKFSEAYDAVNESVNTATSAYSNWLRVLQGTAVPLADVKLGILDYARQLLEVRNNTELSPFEKQQQDLKLVAQAQDTATQALGRFVEESGGNYDAFKGKVNVLSLELTEGLATSLGISNEKAAELVAEIIKIPDAGQFGELAGIRDNITGMDTLLGRITMFILSKPENKVALDAADAKGKTEMLNAWIVQYAGSDPTALAYINTLDAETKAGLVEDLLTGIDGASATATIYINTELLGENATKADARRLAQEARRNRNARGSIVTSPIISLVGEAGPEIILPLTDKDRMAELLRQTGIEAATASAMAAALAASGAAPGGGGPRPMAAGAVVGAPAGMAPGGEDGLLVIDWKAENRGLDEWSLLTAALFANTTMTIITTLTKWEADTMVVTDRLGLSMRTSMDNTGMALRASLAATLGSMSGMASEGGTSIVAALRTSLDEGAGVVTAVVRNYSKSLGNALNPILTATGAKTIDVSKFREGGIAESTPRIAADGEYAVHVFAEKGTHGEAYIPFDPALRSNSRAIADETVRRLGGKAQWFRSGGVTGDTQGLNPAFHSRLDQFAGAVGMPYYVKSGYRSMSEQAELYRKYLNGTGNLAAPPGRSMHEYGLAADGPHWSSKHPELFGITYPLLGKGEPWHAEIAGARQIAKGLLPDTGSIPGLVPMPEVPVVPDRGEFKRAAVAAMDYARKEALRWAGSVSFDQPTAGIADLIAAGIPVNLARALATIRSKESGGNYQAENPDSSASGAYQFLTGTWAGFGGYPTAGSAPKAVQDAKAVQFLQSIMARYPGVLEAIPAAWFTGSYPGHGRMNFTPPGNRITLQAYVDDWLRRYATIPGYENGGLTLREQLVRVSEKNKPELILPLTKPSRVRELADQHGLTEFLMKQEQRRNDRPNLNVTLEAPTAERPDTYAASLRNRLAPLMGSDT